MSTTTLPDIQTGDLDIGPCPFTFDAPELTKSLTKKGWEPYLTFRGSDYVGLDSVLDHLDNHDIERELVRLFC